MLNTASTRLNIKDVFDFMKFLFKRRRKHCMNKKIREIRIKKQPVLQRVKAPFYFFTADNRLYLGDKELNVVSFQLLLSVLEYQTAVMRRDFETADKVLPTIPKEQRTRVAHFLEKQGFKQQALVVSSDPGACEKCLAFFLSQNMIICGN